MSVVTTAKKKSFREAMEEHITTAHCEEKRASTWYSQLAMVVPRHNLDLEDDVRSPHYDRS